MDCKVRPGTCRLLRAATSQ